MYVTVLKSSFLGLVFPQSFHKSTVVGVTLKRLLIRFA